MVDTLKFPKEGRRVIAIDPDSDDMLEQFAAAVARIEQGLQDVQNTLDVLVAVLAMGESAAGAELRDPAVRLAPAAPPAAAAAPAAGAAAIRERRNPPRNVPDDPRD